MKIPVVDSSNSYNQFISHLNKNHLLSAFDEGFLQGISLYVDDMRLLKNICNEFLIYYNRLNTTELDCNKMFALITYKNLFPRDFSDLQLNRGFVYTLFDKKQDFIKKRRTAILPEIQKLEQRIQNAHSELAQSAQELTLIYDHKKARNGYYSYSLSPSDQEEYNRRLQAVNDRNNNNLQELEKKLTEYNNKLQKLDCESLSSIITRDNVDEVFSLVSTNEIGEEINFNFVNAAPFLLRFSPKNITLTDEQRNILFDKAIICNELLDTQYSSILTSLDLYYDAFNVPGIQETKLKILISEHIIRMNPESLKYMRDEYPSAVLFFIKRNIGKYADIMNEDLFDQLELLEILSWGIPDSIKLSLLSFAENGISIIGKNYSLQVCAYILTNNLLQEDIIHLYLSYETLPTQIQEIVFEHAKKDVHEIILNPTTAAKLLKEKLLATSAISIEDRIALFAAIIPHIEQADTRKYLSMLGLDNFSKIFDSHSKPKFEITSQNQHILDAFKLKGWIYEYVEDESHPGYYKIRRRVPKKIENV